jgi:hypothetical protein
MVEDKSLKQSPFYEDLIEDVGGDRVEKSIITVLSARFGSVSARMSERIHSLRERNSALLNKLIKLVVTAKDLGDFERKLDKMG